MTREQLNNLVVRARKFAAEAHQGQTRKYTGDPYMVHPTQVAAMVAAMGDVGEGFECHARAIVAAYLHDVVEDTDVTVDDIRDEFGPEVARLVEELTDVSKPEDGNRSFRKAMDREHLSKASHVAREIKYADLINNAFDIVLHDPRFAGVYLEEKRLLLEAMDNGCDTPLRQLAVDTLNDGLATLNA